MCPNYYGVHGTEWFLKFVILSAYRKNYRVNQNSWLPKKRDMEEKIKHAKVSFKILEF